MEEALDLSSDRLLNDFIFIYICLWCRFVCLRYIFVRDMTSSSLRSGLVSHHDIVLLRTSARPLNLRRKHGNSLNKNWFLSNLTVYCAHVVPVVQVQFLLDFTPAVYGVAVCHETYRHRTFCSS